MDHDLVEERLEEELQEDEKHTKIAFLFTGIVILLLIINLIYLNVAIFSHQTISSVTSEPSPNPSASVSPTVLLSPSPSASVQPITSPTMAVVQNPSVTEYFIPFGSGTSQATDWTDVPGMQTTVDFGQYPNIKEVRFEASVYVPTANQSVLVRLFNVSDKHPVWYSEVSMIGNASTYLTSQPIIYNTGSKIYQVQVKTQLGALTNLVQAKLHVLLK